MAQATLLKAISAATTSTNIYVRGADSITVQCTPDAASGFTGRISINGAFVPNPVASAFRSIVIYPIVTFPLSPWFRITLLDFSAHASTLAFTLGLSGVWTWIQAQVMSASFGSISLYMAY